MPFKKITIYAVLLLFSFCVPAFASESIMHGAGEDSGGEYFEDNGSFNERPEEENRELGKIMESINAELEETKPVPGETGRVIFICKSDKVTCQCIRIVTYDERDLRYEFDLSKALSYTLSETVPTGRYNIINAYDENGNEFFVLDDHFTVSNGETTSVSVFRSKENESEAKHIEPLPEEESTAEEASVDPKTSMPWWLIPVSVLLAVTILVRVIILKSRKRKKPI